MAATVAAERRQRKRKRFPHGNYTGELDHRTGESEQMAAVGIQ